MATSLTLATPFTSTVWKYSVCTSDVNLLITFAPSISHSSSLHYFWNACFHLLLSNAPLRWLDRWGAVPGKKGTNSWILVLFRNCTQPDPIPSHPIPYKHQRGSQPGLATKGVTLCTFTGCIEQAAYCNLDQKMWIILVCVTLWCL